LQPKPWPILVQAAEWANCSSRCQSGGAIRRFFSA
jgi:hypothetical protein